MFVSLSRMRKNVVWTTAVLTMSLWANDPGLTSCCKYTRWRTLSGFLCFFLSSSTVYLVRLYVLYMYVYIYLCVFLEITSCFTVHCDHAEVYHSSVLLAMPCTFIFSFYLSGKSTGITLLTLYPCLCIWCLWSQTKLKQYRSNKQRQKWTNKIPRVCV